MNIDDLGTNVGLKQIIDSANYIPPVAGIPQSEHHFLFVGIIIKLINIKINNIIADCLKIQIRWRVVGQ